MSARHQEWFAGDSHVGLVRSGNEDAFLLAPPLFAVADGLGGHHAGEVASSIAIDTLLAHAPRDADTKALGRAARRANAAVIEAAETGRGRSGMGTTLTAAMLDGTRIALTHVGDSRAYLLHLGSLEQLTDDHSMVADLVRQGRLTAEEAREHPNRSVITRALGSDRDMLPDTFEIEAASGDRLLLATDGLTGLVTDGEIERVLGSAPTPADAVDTLIDAALDAGGHDNVTVVVVDIGKPRGASTRSGRAAGGPRWGLRILWLVALVAVIAGAAWVADSYARSQAYLIEESGVIAVYEGVPGSFAGIALNWPSEVTTIPVSALDPITATRLRTGIRFDGLAAALARIEEYRSRISAETTPAVAP
ncbi:MAG TPA: Stp1/IreP family PP2C-type Ser/Thr phosphatase [Coriobacteriia bacterium]|nr:Stp1/IreP family PP2C-type Ser/Thr phosphatase [Coriobacteriia bacterium]